MNVHDFLPVSRDDMVSRSWYYYDFLLVTGDAYVDHPSFGAAVIGRVLEAEGYRVAVLAQPFFRDPSAFTAMGRPRYAALVTAGNLDSMVAHYTAAKKPRRDDLYSPGKKARLRPDRAVIAYTKLVNEAFPGLPVVIGGLEASLRRFAHYDYWDDKVRRPILFDSGADLLIYGMGESAIVEVAKKLSAREGIQSITDIRGTCFIQNTRGRFSCVESDASLDTGGRFSCVQGDASLDTGGRFSCVEGNASSNTGGRFSCVEGDASLNTGGRFSCVASSNTGEPSPCAVSLSTGEPSPCVASSSTGEPSPCVASSSTGEPSPCVAPCVVCASFSEVSEDKNAYARAAMIQYDEHDPVRGRVVVQHCDGKALVVNPPSLPLAAAELDKVYALPFIRDAHPMYGRSGGVPAIDEVRFSVIHNRGCFGACNFCALSFHQGRMVSSRSHESVINEVKRFVGHPEFKGNVHDVGGPTANFRHPSCKKQLKDGMCAFKVCLAPKPCSNIDASHTDYLLLLRKLAAIPGVKKVFVRSGIRFDYLMLDRNGEFFAELVKNHISGQLKVAPEHCVDNVLRYMGKPHNAAYERFCEKYQRLNARYGKEQYLVPYLISSHPGCTIGDAISLAEYLNKSGRQPEQVQDFYPTPGTLSTCMYYTGLDPRTLEPVHVPRSPKEKAIQRALLQWRKPENRNTIHKALREAGREDLIGYGKHCLIRPGRKP